jgi:cation:H+ antiporter
VAPAIFLLLGGTAILAIGAEVAIRGAVRFARARSLSPFMIGALLFGVDVESLGSALIAAGRDQTSLAAGGAFGTIVFVFSAAFGAALLLAPKPIESPSKEMVLLPAGALVAGGFALADGVVGRLEGLGLLAIYGFYVNLVLAEGREARARGRELEREALERPRFPPWLQLLVGIGLVYAGATVMVEGGIRLLERTALAAGFVGAAIIGALASFDELFLEVVPILRGYPELATGNLFGTVAAFSTGVLGLAALVRPLELDGAAGSAFVAAAALYAVVATAFLSRRRAGKAVGLVVLAGYAGWMLFAARI